MYTVGAENLPSTQFVAEAIDLMQLSLAELKDLPGTAGLEFAGQVYRDTSDPTRFEVVGYCGRITCLIVEPPSFNVFVHDAWKEIALCDCPSVDIDRMWEDFDGAMDEAELSMELDDMAGAPTIDPHIEAILFGPNTEVNIRFDRLGWYGVHGIRGNIA